MRRTAKVARLPGVAAAAIFAVTCSDAVDPTRRTGHPDLDVAQGRGSGTLGVRGRMLVKGFNPVNPHHGDAVIATFFWLGSENIIDTVFDHLTNGTPVGNRYQLVEYVTAGGISMATYVATNVQNFPDPNSSQDDILVVRALLRDSITDGGMEITSWTGVEPEPGQAVQSSNSRSGSDTAVTAASPGPVSVGPGGLVYAVTMSDGIFGTDPPQGFSMVGGGADDSIKTDSRYAMFANGGTVDPRWTYFYNAERRWTWLATALALAPPGAAPAAPAPTRLAFTPLPATVTAGSAISPAVRVTAQDDAGNTATEFGGTVTLAIGTNAGGGTLFGSTSAPAVNGIATFSNVSIDKAGAGYTLRATSTGLSAATSNAFTVTAGPVSAAQSTLEAMPDTITVGNGTATIVVTARDAQGNPVGGAAVALSVSGTENSLTQPAGPTDQAGAASGTLSSSVAEAKTVTATIGGVAVSQAATVTVIDPVEIVLAEWNGTLNQSGFVLGKEFNPRNPPLGSTIVATFVWEGSTNVITSVSDHLWNGTVVGNTYTLVEYVTLNGISMATYVATDVQNFPDPKGGAGQELIVRADLSASVPSGGAAIAAYTGVHPDLEQALGAHRSATGFDAQGIARPGSVAADAGALVYATSMVSDGLVGMDPPPGFIKLGTGSTDTYQIDVENALPDTAGSFNPRWAWTFTSPNTWLATVLTLKPAGAVIP